MNSKEKLANFHFKTVESSIAMFLNYLKIAWRSLLKNKVYSLINIIGLASGMAITIMIGLWITNEFSYNKTFQNHDTIAQVYQTQTFNDQIDTWMGIPRPLEFLLRTSYKGSFKNIAMSSWTNSNDLRVGKNSISRSGNYLQEEGLQIFTPTIVKGSKNGLKDKMSLMLSESTSKVLFGDKDPIGQFVEVNNAESFIVTAIYKDFPKNSAFSEVDWFIPWKHYITTQKWIKDAADSWSNNSFQMFVQIADNTSILEVNKKIRDSKTNANAETVEFDPKIFLLPMEDWYLRSSFKDGIQTGGRIESVWLFGIVGLFILFLACINFINLSTAKSEKRSKEVGVRKSLGSNRQQLIGQFLTESFLLVCISFLISIMLVNVFLNGFNQIASKTVAFPWTNIWFWICAIIFILFTALLSGSYPAFYLSSFNPVTVLKGTFNTGRFSALPRKILVVFQFVISLTLIIGTIIVMNQINYSKNRPIGYQKEGLIQIPTFSKVFSGKSDLIRERLIASGAAIEVASVSSPLTELWNNFDGFSWEGKPVDFQDTFGWAEVSYEFVNTLGMNVVEGRGFSREFPSDSSAVLINQTAKKYMGMTNPVGKFIRVEEGLLPSEELKIIGVVEDVIISSPYTPVKQQIYVLDKNGKNNFLIVRLNPNKSISDNLTTIESTYKSIFSTIPYSFEFVDEQYAMKYATEQRIASLAKVFTLLAILISCLGLFGLSSYVVEKRKKEFGVRTVLGATVANLYALISKEFLVLIIIAIVVSFPLTYYIMDSWLQQFDYRVSISSKAFIVAGLSILIITLITISYHSIKAALVNPINSLRAE